MRWMFRGVKCLLVVLVVAAALSFVVMHLWNWLMPALFALHPITFWQALGLLVLSKILLGGFRGRRCGGPGHWKGQWKERMMARWAEMTPEEREKMRAGMKRRCGMWGSRTPEAEA